MPTHYTLKEKLSLLLIFIVAGVSLFIYLKYRAAAFPEHSIDFKISRAEAEAKAKEMALSRGFNLEGYESATVFEIDDFGKTYLERELGAEKTGELGQDEVDLWHFTTRFFKPLTQEELQISFLPNGRFVNLTHLVEENRNGAKLKEEEARGAAERFVNNMEEWKPVASEKQERPNRWDYTFTWEKANFKAGEATYRMIVGVQGDKVGSYSEHLKIPESAERAYEAELSKNSLAQIAAEAVNVLLFDLGIIIMFFIFFRKRLMRFRFPVAVGSVVAAFALLGGLNTLPLLKFYYPTIASYGSFAGLNLVQIILGSLLNGLIALGLVIAAEAMYRQARPYKLSVEKSLGSALFSKQTGKAFIVGSAFGIIMLVYQLGYYFFGRQVGYWVPAEIKYNDLFSTVIPWVYPLLIGLLAAVSEEGLYRLFGIPFLEGLFQKIGKKLPRRWPLFFAVLVSSAVWAFLHSAYPQSPWFARGLELIPAGIVFSILFLRYGILASVSAHYTFNAFQTAVLFWSSQSSYIGLSSTIIAFAPLILGVGVAGRAILKKGFVKVKEEWTNAALTGKTEPEVKAAAEQKTEPKQAGETDYLSKIKIAILIALGLASAVVIYLLLPKVWLGYYKYPLGRNEIRAASIADLEHRGVDANSYQSVVTGPSTGGGDEIVSRYVLEHANFEVWKKLSGDLYPPSWLVRFYRPLQKEEYLVRVSPQGSAQNITHVLDEDAKGANLAREAAREIADKFLQARAGENFQNLAIVEEQAEQRKNRTDYVFTYEDRQNKIAEATRRTDVTVGGDEVLESNSYLKLPEAWEREQQRLGPREFAVIVVSIILGVTLFVLALIAFVGLLRQKALRWKTGFIFGGVFAAASVVQVINSLPTIFNGYFTAVPIWRYLAIIFLIGIISMVLLFLLTALAVVFAKALWEKEAQGETGTARFRDKKLFRDALVMGYTLPFAVEAGGAAGSYILISKGWLRYLPSYDFLGSLDSFFPALNVAASVPAMLIVFAAALSVPLVLHRFLKKWKWVALLIFAAGMVPLLSEKSVVEAITNGVEWAVTAAFIIAAAGLFLRRNLLAYALSVYVSILAIPAFVYLLQPDLNLKMGGVFLLLLLLAPIGGYALARRRYLY